jgi:hypothetical protein
MKKFALFCTAIGSVFSYSCFAQSNVKTLTDASSKNDLAVVSYHVEERINMNFGGSIRTYDVTNLNLITPKDLGKNNIRIITPKYGKINAKAVAVETVSSGGIKSTVEAIKSSARVNATVATPPKEKVLAAPDVTRDYVNIDIVGTYERILDKGYKSVDMIIKVADKHFFAGDMTLAAKWYTELFNNKTDLEAVYYYRYAQSLLDTGQTAKGNEMMKVFESKSL